MEPSRRAPLASDADRERAVALLGEHHALGRLTLEDVEARSTAAYAARTLAELDALTEDLPTPVPSPLSPDAPPRMRPLREVGTRELVWRTASLLGGGDELWAGEELVATLRPRKSLSSDAQGAAAEGRWLLERNWRSQVTVRALPSEAELGRFRPRWTGGGELALRDGRLQWRRRGMWRPEHTWTDGDGVPLVRFRRLRTPRLETAAEVEAVAVDLGELSLLLLLGRYLIHREQDDAGAAAGAGGAAAAGA